jgi:hypothetical protein
MSTSVDAASVAIMVCAKPVWMPEGSASGSLVPWRGGVTIRGVTDDNAEAWEVELLRDSSGVPEEMFDIKVECLPRDVLPFD